MPLATHTPCSDCLTSSSFHIKGFSKCCLRTVKNLIRSWKLFGISMLIMKILLMGLLNMRIKSKKATAYLDRIIVQGKRSNVITSFLFYTGLFLPCTYWKRVKEVWDAIVPRIFHPDFRIQMGFLCSVNILVACKRRDRAVLKMYSSTQQPLGSCNERREPPPGKEEKSK